MIWLTRVPLVLFAASTCVFPSTIVVDPTGSGDYTEIQPAIDAASDGDTVLVRVGDYVIAEPINFNRLRDPEDPASPPVKNITLRSEGGAEATTIMMSPDNSNQERVVTFENGEDVSSMVDGFTLRRGSGGVACLGGSSPVFESCTISDNSAYTGGGILCTGNASPSFTNCTISGNVAAVDGAGGGVFCMNASPSFTSCAIFGNSAGVGGGVHCHSSSPSFTDCTISGNSALDREYRYFRYSRGGGGGVYCYDAFPSLTNCTISGNAADVGGGIRIVDASRAIHGSPDLANCIVWGNAGGAIVASGQERPRITYSCVEGAEIWPGEGNINSDPLFCGWGPGAEIFVDAGSGEPGNGSRRRPFRTLPAALASFRLSLTRESPCVGAGAEGANMGAGNGVCDGAPTRAAVLHLAAGRYPTTGIAVAHWASIQGAGEEDTVVEGTIWGLRTGAYLSDLTVTAGQGGGLRVGGREAPDIRNCTISGNSGLLGGGMFCGDNASPILTNCRITKNSGAGLCCAGNAEPKLMTCTISGNSPSDIYSWYSWSTPGGGVRCSGNASPSLTNCTITGNSSGYSGSRAGGVSCSGSASPTFTNCAISGNSSLRAAGGISCEDDSSPRFTNCVVTGNAAFELSDIGIHEGIGGVSCTHNAFPIFTNCIVWHNQGDAIAASATSTPFITYSCVESPEPWPGEGNIHADPRFLLAVWRDCDPFSSVDCIPYQWDADQEPVAGHRWIFDPELQPGSACIDAGVTIGAPTTDIEGNGRPCGAGVDMGSYELGGCLPPTIHFVRGNADDQGATDIADVTFVLSYLYLGGAKPRCLDAADFDDTGVLDITDAVYLLTFLFVRGPSPEEPFVVCGIDPTIDLLTCEQYASCE